MSDSGTERETGEHSGVVNVRGEEEYCEVWVDGAFAGNTPARLLLQGGTHVLELRRPGYKVHRRELLVLAGAEVSFWAAMEREK